MAYNKLKIIIVDDSKVTRELIKHLLSFNPHLEIVGVAENGLEAYEFIKKTPPDVVLTDIVMPKMNGIELTKKIMQTHPMPVIVMSGVYSAEEIRRSFDLIDAGAIAIMEKPQGIADEHFSETAKFIFETARALATVRGFYQQQPSVTAVPKFAAPILARINNQHLPQAQIKAVAIGSSIGGPKALQMLLTPLGSQTKAPIFIVQHITAGFVEGFVDWLNRSIPLPVKLAKHNEKALAGHVYVAPDKDHLTIDAQGLMILSDESSKSLYIPSVDKLFESLSSSYGSNALGILLLGAEKDGLNGLQKVKSNRGLTLMENPSSAKADTRPLDDTHQMASISDIGAILSELISAK